MSTLPSHSDNTASEVLAVLRNFEDFGNEQFMSAGDAELNHVLVSERYVLKMPRWEPRITGFGGIVADDRARSAEFEACMVYAINEASLLPPVTIPHVIESHCGNPPYFTALSRVKGTVLGQEKVHTFSIEEKQDLGRKFGEFVVWMGQSVSLETYQEIVERTRPQVPDRADYIRSWYSRARARDDIPSELAALLFDVYDEYRNRVKDGSICEKIIGHDDLRPAGNMAFLQKAGKHVLNGVFDFGLSKPSSPERELRHLAPFPEALEAGIETYEVATGCHLDHELIELWAIAQLATNATGMLMSGNVDGAASKLTDMQLLLPAKRIRQIRADCGI